MTDDDRVCMPREALQVLLEDAAEKGAARALDKIGLNDDAAFKDIRDMRSFVGIVRTASNTFLQTIVRSVTIGMMLLLFAGAVFKLKGGQ